MFFLVVRCAVLRMHTAGIKSARRGRHVRGAPRAHTEYRPETGDRDRAETCTLEGGQRELRRGERAHSQHRLDMGALHRWYVPRAWRLKHVVYIVCTAS